MALASTVHATVGLALEPGEPSLTQERRAGLRAIAAMDPDARVRNPDHLAERLLPAEFWLFGSFTRDYAKTREFVRTYQITDYYTVNAMTWHIDGILKEIAANGLEQVVHVGAGLDSRPYRLGEEMPGVRFFEVDQPATLDLKKARVRAVLGSLPGTVTYIPFDYRSHPVFASLGRAGFDPRRKTLFIWEGTTMLTDPKVVDETLRSIAQRSGPGSEVVFDYVLDAVVRGDFNRYGGARYEVVRSSIKGEPWRFGIAEGRAEEFVNRCGLDFVSDLGAGELASRYLVRSDGSLDGQPTPYWRVVHAAVSE
ncbi:MAG: SAM-dependent methyltransferase [Myxococcota bacterium]|nr:SAM-dependent methyltransferase [Myxococcota bacterium]